ncbi:MAG TPA: ATP-binding protein, partial [Chloroflexota bacterium]|nr:ATP-binding protein [Chloroflexota bacterium]
MVALPTTRAPRPAAGTGRYVGTLVGESTSRQFRLALAHEAVREQDLIAVDATLHHGPPDEDAPRPRGTTPHGTSGSEAGRERPERVRIWAKVERIERINPLFPAESGHELAATGTDPLDTVLSLSRELVTAVCRVLGAEPLDGKWDGKLRHLRYPPRPASRAYRPAAGDVTRIVLGQLQEQPQRSLDLAELANRPEVDVRVDGHAIVTRHLAILAMTGAGKSWTARRLVEELAGKGYPMVIFDPHGDYTGLAGVPALRHRVRLYYAELPMLGADVDDAIRIISG